MHQRLDKDRTEAKNQMNSLLGRHDPHATTVIDDVVRAAYQGRVDTIFLREQETAWGHDDQDGDQIIHGGGIEQGDLVQAAVAQTLQHGGTVHLLSDADPITGPTPPAAAVLRY